MNRARLYAAAAALLAALVLARLLSPSAPPHTTLALPVSPPPTAVPASPTRPPSPAPSPAPPALDDLRAALGALDAARLAAYADPPRGDPGAWAARTCACHADDVRRLRDLARAGLALRGHRVTVDSLTLTGPPTTTRAELLLVDRVSAYGAVDASGRTVARWPASGPRRWHVTLVRAAGRWTYGHLARAP